jgi:hypothetical protein
MVFVIAKPSTGDRTILPHQKGAVKYHTCWGAA